MCCQKRLFVFYVNVELRISLIQVVKREASGSGNMADQGFVGRRMFEGRMGKEEQYVLLHGERKCTASDCVCHTLDTRIPIK